MKIALELNAQAEKALSAVTVLQNTVQQLQKEEATASLAQLAAKEQEKAKEKAKEQETVQEKTTPVHIRRKNIPKHIKTLVWNKFIGSDIAQAKCMSCREEMISIRSFHCGHVIAESLGGDVTIINLRPICAACNASMGIQSMNEFTSSYFGWTV